LAQWLVQFQLPLPQKPELVFVFEDCGNHFEKISPQRRRERKENQNHSSTRFHPVFT
jgi:hypothetical protein